MIRPNDEEIEKVVAELECGWIQARNHLIGRDHARRAMEQRRRAAINEGIRNLAQQ